MPKIMVTSYCFTSLILDKLKEINVNFVEAHHRSNTIEYYLEKLKECSGLVLSGGEDISPFFYTEEAIHAYYNNEQRDRFELRLLEEATQLGIKVLGICRGHQLINVAFAGTLIQDMRHKEPKHTVSLDGFGRELFNSVRTYTNSLHHQAVDKLGEGLEVIGKHMDGTVEAIYSPEYKCLGVQWHPELMNTTQEVFTWVTN